MYVLLTFIAHNDPFQFPIQTGITYPKISLLSQLGVENGEGPLFDFEKRLFLSYRPPNLAKKLKFLKFATHI